MNAAPAEVELTLPRPDTRRHAGAGSALGRLQMRTRNGSAEPRFTPAEVAAACDEF